MNYDSHALASPPSDPDLEGRSVTRYIDTEESSILAEIELGRDEITAVRDAITGDELPVSMLTAKEQERIWEQAWEDWRAEQ